MILRGFDGEYVTFTNDKITLKDFMYMLFWILFFIIIKFINIPLFIGDLVVGSL